MKMPLKLRYRLWFEFEGEYAFGNGVALLLHRVHELGSLKKAAENLNMPYRGAWGRIRKAEKALGMELVESSRDRQKGVTLTPKALAILEAFDRLDALCLASLRADAEELGSPDFEITDIGH